MLNCQRITCVQVSLLGDLSALCGAISIIGYLEVGRRLRAWMPIFLYACPVTGERSHHCWLT